MIPSSFSFDLILPDLKTGHSPQVVGKMADEIFKMVGIHHRDMQIHFQQQLDSRSAGLGFGCILFDMRAKTLTQPFTVLARTKRGIDMGVSDGMPVDIFCALILPEMDGTYALQHLARWSRLLKNSDFLRDLRLAEDADDIRILMANPRTQLIAA